MSIRALEQQRHDKRRRFTTSSGFCNSTYTVSSGLLECGNPTFPLVGFSGFPSPLAYNYPRKWRMFTNSYSKTFFIKGETFWEIWASFHFPVCIVIEMLIGQTSDKTTAFISILHSQCFTIWSRFFPVLRKMLKALNMVHKDSTHQNPRGIGVLAKSQ